MRGIPFAYSPCMSALGGNDAVIHDAEILTQRDAGWSIQLRFWAGHVAGRGASTDSNLIDAMNHDAAVLKQKKHITPKSFTFLMLWKFFQISKWSYVVAAAPPTSDAMIH
jgi:hypothetical protein